MINNSMETKINNGSLSSMPNSANKSLYFASSLFNTRECLFNIKLAEKLEDKNYKVFLPQRDGFEFLELSRALKEANVEISEYEAS